MKQNTSENIFFKPLELSDRPIILSENFISLHIEVAL